MCASAQRAPARTEEGDATQRAGGAAEGGGAYVSAPTPAVPLPRSLRARDYGALDKSQYATFVRFFRQASPYIEGHRGRTFVLAIPGEVRSWPRSMAALLGGAP